METDMIAISPATLFVFGPGDGPGGEEPDEPEQEEESDTPTPEREEAPQAGEKTESTPHRETSEHLQ